MNQIAHVLPWMSSAARVIALATGFTLAACGGGYGGGGSSAPGPAVSLSVQPTTITLGQVAMLTWSSSAGSSCAASGAWSGTEAASGTQSVTPTAVGTVTYTL